MPTLMEALAENLKDILEQKKMSQTEFAKRLKISFQTANAYFNARTGFSKKMIQDMARVLEVEETELVREKHHLKYDSSAVQQLAIEISKLKLENENLKLRCSELQKQIPSDPNTKDINLILATLDESQRRSILRYIQGVARISASSSAIKDREKKIK